MSIITFEELIKQTKENNCSIYEIAQKEEVELSEISVDEIRNNARKNLVVMKEAIQKGLKSSEKSISNWCGDDTIKMVEKFKKQNNKYVR